MRKYTVECSRPNGIPSIKHTYEGFNRRFTPSPTFLALVRTDGEENIYALEDSSGAVAELQRYLKENDSGVLCAVYKVVW